MNETDFDEKESKNFYYNGKFFDTQKEFWEYVQEVSNRATTEEDFDRLFTTLKKDIWLNLQIYAKEITNCELQAFTEEMFAQCMQKLLLKLEKKMSKCREVDNFLKKDQ